MSSLKIDYDKSAMIKKIKAAKRIAVHTIDHGLIEKFNLDYYTGKQKKSFFSSAKNSNEFVFANNVNLDKISKNNIDNLYQEQMPFGSFWVTPIESHKPLGQAFPSGISFLIYSFFYDKERGLITLAANVSNTGDKTVRIFRSPDLSCRTCQFVSVFRLSLKKINERLGEIEQSGSSEHLKEARKGASLENIVNRLVIIDTTANRKTYPPNDNPSVVARNHRWDVAGHWRNIKGIGRDFAGNLIYGKTWVNSHIKGPEDKPYIQKTRFIKPTQPLT